MVELLPKEPWRFSHQDLLKLGRLLVRAAVRVVGALVMGALLVMHRAWPVPVPVFASMAVLSLSAGLFWRYHVRRTPLRHTSPRNAERLIWVASILMIAGVQIAIQSVGNHDALAAHTPQPVAFLFLAPMVAGAMLVSALIGPMQSLVALTLTALLLGASQALPVELLAAAWLAGAVGAHAVDPMKRRNDLFRAVSVQVVTNAIIASCSYMAQNANYWLAAQSACWAAVAAVIATSVFWLGAVVLERVFGIVSDWTLLELCSPEQPLIRELCLRAPGTYAHSVMVGNLAENAARAIGANPVLCRALAYYHDVGKMVRPSYFIENQASENVHDEMSPTLSAQVIAAHVKDGLNLAKQHRLPPVLVEGIAQHHGTSLIRYFYARALQANKEPDCADSDLESFFRYDGPAPQGRETAILHLADMVEAASRSWSKEAEIREMVSQIIEKTRADGQLDHCDLTFLELQHIKETFIRSLSAIRHERVSYPGKEENGEDRGPENSSSKRIRAAVEM